MKCLLLTACMAMFHSSLSQSLQVSSNTWMSDMMPVIGSQLLTNITLIGTHDSFAYNLSTTGSFADSLSISFGTSQILDAYDQATAGVRYFDLRCGYDAAFQTWRAYHGSYGPTVESIVDQLRSFMLSHPSEVIVIEASHFSFQSATARSSPTTDQVAQLYELFNATFSPMLLPRSSGFSDSISTMVNNNQRVVMTVEQCGSLIVNYPIWCSGALVNTFANTNKIQTMITYNTQQLSSFQTRRTILASNNQLFKMSWTLTPADVDITNSLIIPSAPKTLQAMAFIANSQWPTFLDQIDMNNQVVPNIVLFDFVEEISLAQFLSASYSRNITVNTQLPSFSSTGDDGSDAPLDASSTAVGMTSTASVPSNSATTHSAIGGSVTASLLLAYLLLLV